MLFPSLFVCRIQILVPKRQVAAKEGEHVLFNGLPLYLTIIERHLSNVPRASSANLPSTF